MSVNNDSFSEDLFFKIFSYKKIQNLLCKDLCSYSLIYYFMRFFISRISLGPDSFNSSKPSNSKFLLETLIQKKDIFKLLFKTPIIKDDLDILFFSRSRFVPIRTSDGKVIVSDYLFGGIIDSLNINKPNLRFLFFVDNLFKPIPKECCLEVHSFFEFSNFYTFIKSLIISFSIYFEWIIHKKKIIEHIKFNNCDFLVLLFVQFFSFQSLFSFIFYDHCFKNVLLKTKPKIVIANDDILSLRPKHSSKVKFVIVQSASIISQKEKLIKMFSSFFSLNKFAVDYFLVTGCKFINMKKTTGDCREVKVIGQPRYDSLFHINKLYSKTQIFSKYHINPSHKIILWTTQFTAMDDEEIILTFDTVFSTLKDFKNITLIIKQHPGESHNHRKLIKTYLHKYHLNAVLPPKNSDTFEFLHICDCMISKSSTTITEAIILNKPVIVLNLGKTSDMQDYVQEGVAIGVYIESNLKPAIEKLIFCGDESMIYRNSFIQNYVYKFDGMATNRVLQFINNLLHG